ncbi:WG repeat-containing protein [Aquirufa sp.]|jgi:hypothetical protein|uniref:WG repeat-containing protein n=1 Tax=Aquirufa sp. TaxID=2676249 RepID=UPI0037C0CB70
MKYRLIGIVIFSFLQLFTSCYLFNFKDKYELIPVKSDSKWGYINKKGNYIINPQFAEANLFYDDLALVKEDGPDGKYGFINKEGQFIIKPTYKFATSFSEGLAWVTSTLSHPQLINTKGEVITELKSATYVYTFNEGLAAFSNDKNLYGFVNKSGEVVITPQFHSVGYFSQGLCAVSNEKGDVGFIDKTGKLVMNYQFGGSVLLESFTFHEDLCVVLGKNDKYGVINKEGEFVINPQYEYLNDNCNGMFGFRMENKLGWIDKTGKILINPQFEDFSQFVYNGLAPILSGKTYGYIDKEGSFKINPQFEMAYAFIGKIAAVRSGEKFGFIDGEGKFVINPQFDDVHIDVMFPSKRPMNMGVPTDYLDTGKLIDFLKPDGNGGFNGDTFSSSLNDLIISYKLDRENINLYSNQLPIITGLVLSKNFTVDYYADFLKMGEYKEIIEGWYTSQKYIPLYNEKPWLYQVVIQLKGDAIGRAESVMSLVSAKYSGTLNPKSSENNKVYELDKNTLLLIRKLDYEKILVAVIKKKHLKMDLFAYQESSSSSSNYDRYASSDTAAVADDYAEVDTASAY